MDDKIQYMGQQNYFQKRFCASICTVCDRGAEYVRFSRQFYHHPPPTSIPIRFSALDTVKHPLLLLSRRNIGAKTGGVHAPLGIPDSCAGLENQWSKCSPCLSGVEISKNVRMRMLLKNMQVWLGLCTKRPPAVFQVILYMRLLVF